MKYLIKSLGVLSLSVIVSLILIPIEFVYSFGYSIWLTITLKDWKAFFKFWCRLIDGISYSIGYILYNIGFALDLIWNVNGEVIEDVVTAEEDTEFTNKETTVSASIGKLEIEGKLNDTGKWLSRLLNIVFRQRAHAIDSWNFKVAKDKLRSGYFQK